MNNNKIDLLFETLLISDVVQKLESYPNVQWLFQASGFPIVVRTQEKMNRIKIVAFIEDARKLEIQKLQKVLEANYHSTMDARYSLTDGYFVSLYFHHFKELSEEQFLNALWQVISCAETFGSTYSGGSFSFGPSVSAPLRSKKQDPLAKLTHKIKTQASDNLVFISYSHKDSEWLKLVLTMIKPLIRNNSLTIWYDKEAKPSSKWRNEIAMALEKAKAAVLLVSPNFLASDFISTNEVPYLLEAAENNRVNVSWILLRDCLYKETEISECEALHDTAKPLNSLQSAELDSVLVKICVKINSLSKTLA
jgi:hypothetical protein